MSRSLLMSLLLGVLAVATFWGIHGYEFISIDDQGYLVENPQVRAGLTWGGIGWALTATYAANWHPLTWVSHMLDAQVFGMDAGAHHVVNLLFHGANGVLLFLVLSRMSGAFWRSALVAALFAVHPLHVESVAWVSERKDVLSTLLWFVTLGAYLRYVRRPGWGALTAALVAYALGLMAKPMLVTLPFVLLLLDWWPLARWGPGTGAAASAARGVPGVLPPARLWCEKIPFFALAAASAWITYRVQESVGATASWKSLTFPARLANAGVSYVGYLGKTLWPTNLSAFYPHPVALPPWTTLGFVVLILGGATLVAVWQRTRRPALAVGWFWYLGTLVPVIGLVQVGAQAMADRYTYIPLVGLFLAGAWVLAALVERTPSLRLPVTLSVTAVLILLAVAAGRQAGYWRDSGTLFRRALELDPRNYVAHYHLGLVAAARGDAGGAARHYREALQSKPDYAEACSRLADILAAGGQLDEAIDLYRTALRVEPRAVDVRNNLGVTLVQRGDLGGAVAEFQEVLKGDPGYGDAHFNLAKALILRGDTAEAISHFRMLADRNPADPEIQLELGDAYLLLGRREEARNAYLRARVINPSLKGSPLCLGRGNPWCGLVDE